MYRQILVPLDGSELAEKVLPYVNLLGRKLRSAVKLVSVVETVGLGSTLYWDSPISYDISRNYNYLSKLSGRLQLDGLDASFVTVQGSPCIQIVNLADEEPDTLIAMSTHGRSGVSRLIMGSVTDKVLHAATNPLLIVRPTEGEAIADHGQLEGVVVPLDGSYLAEQVLNHVVPLAKALHLKVTLVSVIATAGEYDRFMTYQPIDSMSTVYYGPYEEFSKESEAQSMEYLHQVSDRLRKEGIHDLDERLVRGRAADVIGDIAKETPHNLVAMTTHGRSGLGRWVLGSVTDRVVRRSGAPVLVVRAASQNPVLN